MYRGYLNRRRDSQDRTVSAGQTSPGSSASLPLAPSAASAVHLQASSQSAVVPADHASAARRASTSPKNRFFPISISPAPRSSSLARMGQGVSRTEPAAAPAHADRAPAPPPPVPSPPPSATRFKRGWPVSRRKKSEDTTVGSVRTERSSDDSSERGRDASLSVISSTFTTPASTPAASVDDLQQVPMLLPPFEQRRPQPPKSPKFSGSAPIPPPKPSQLQLSKPPPSPIDTPADSFLRADSATTPASPSAGSDGHKSETGFPREKTDRDLKQDWRKSDATTMSYVTIRPGATVGTRSPRPVSLAESSHSGHTIMPVNKRLSALITDAEFVMAEEGDSDSEVDVLRIPLSGRPSPTSSVKARNRRSASLNLGPGHWSKLASLETTTTHHTQPQTLPLSRTFTDTRLTPASARDQPTLSRTAAKGFISPIATSSVPNPTSSSFRGRLAAWAAFEKQPGQLAPPPTHPMRGQVSPSASSSFRQTAVSMTGSLAPVAFGLGKRAAEKVHRVWGGLSSSSSNHSAFSSTTSLSGSLHSQNSAQGMDRSTSGHSGSSNAFAPGGWKKNRRTPNAPSGAYSVSSSMTNLSDADSVSSTLGRCLREPRRNGAGMAVSGLLFGRDLRACVAETAIESVRANAASRDPNEPPSARALEERALPAFVVRCAQHLRRWGMEEEGLFRVNGRAAHINRVRAAFDTGADYDLVECDLGDLDPHAVSSALKAYLRELPQSILTNALSSLFESVISADNKDTAFVSSGNFDIMKLRKAPSLSTFQQPNIAHMRVASQDTRIALASLIARMPEENRDLLYTVVELIRETATSSRITKMPVVNLVVPFSPSLKMSPPLLIALCETPDIWEGPAKLMDAQRSVSRGSLDDDDEPRTHRNTLHAPDLGELGGSPYRLSNNSGQDDAASYMSALDHPACPSDGSSSNLPALTTSTDSIATPSTMSEVSSLKPQSLDTQEEEDMGCSEKAAVPRRPTIATNDLALPSNPRRPFISSPIPFPSSGEASPYSPVSPRKSLALLSFPPLGKSDNNGQESSTWAHRPKRPSLHMLFSRKSASPICSPVSNPQPVSGGAEASSLSVPPVIDTPISSSPIGLFDPSRPQAKVTVTDFSDTCSGSDRGRRDSFASSLFSTPQQTPIADLYRGAASRSPSPSLRAVTPDLIPSRPSSVARGSPVPSLNINLEKDDWAESVLQATSATDEPESAWRVKDAVKLFEGR